MSWNRKHLLDIQSLTAEEIVTVLDTARAFKAVGERAIKKVPALRGKTVVNLFVEPSTRTRISFELAAQRLTADIINFSAEASSLKKGETLKDTARNLEALNADIIVMRHSASGAPHFLARFLHASVVNAGDGAHEHPTQALLDAFTVREKKGRIAGLNVTILGDILYSRVARSNIWALTKLGAHVTLVRPGDAGAARCSSRWAAVSPIMSRKPSRRRTSSTCCASSTSGSAKPCFPASANTPAFSG